MVTESTVIRHQGELCDYSVAAEVTLRDSNPAASLADKHAPDERGV